MRRRHWTALALAVLMVGLGFVTLSAPFQAMLRYVSLPLRNFADSFDGLEPLGFCLLFAAMLVIYVPVSLVWAVLVRWSGYKTPWWGR